MDLRQNVAHKKNIPWPGVSTTGWELDWESKQTASNKGPNSQALGQQWQESRKQRTPYFWSHVFLSCATLSIINEMLVNTLVVKELVLGSTKKQTTMELHQWKWLAGCLPNSSLYLLRSQKNDFPESSFYLSAAMSLISGQNPFFRLHP